jgi:hypothetical protein
MTIVVARTDDNDPRRDVAASVAAIPTGASTVDRHDIADRSVAHPVSGVEQPVSRLSVAQKPSWPSHERSRHPDSGPNGAGTV